MIALVFGDFFGRASARNLKPAGDSKTIGRKKNVRFLVVWAFLTAATTLEAAGDAFVRTGLFSRTGLSRIAILLLGAALLFGYGAMLNLAPQPFERVVGLYIATLFCVWQVISFIAFGSVPRPPILAGGALIIAGGLIVSFWQ